MPGRYVSGHELLDRWIVPRRHRIYYDAAVGQLTYSVNFFDRCTGTTTTVFKRTDTPNPTFRIFLPAPKGGFAITLPSAKAGAIVVLAQAGTAVAASGAYFLPGSAESC